MWDICESGHQASGHLRKNPRNRQIYAGSDYYIK